jgi:hypothetical protein
VLTPEEAEAVVRSILETVAERGGSGLEVLMALEIIVANVMLCVVTDPEGHAPVMEVFQKNVLQAMRDATLGRAN